MRLPARSKGTRESLSIYSCVSLRGHRIRRSAGVDCFSKSTEISATYPTRDDFDNVGSIRASLDDAIPSQTLIFRDAGHSPAALRQLSSNIRHKSQSRTWAVIDAGLRADVISGLVREPQPTGQHGRVGAGERVGSAGLPSPPLQSLPMITLAEARQTAWHHGDDDGIGTASPLSF
jgi:hypothetical protein